VKSVPNGAIVSRDELTVIAGALACAIELIEMDMDSHNRPNKKFHDVEYLQQMRAWKESRQEYRTILKRVDVALKKCS